MLLCLLSIVWLQMNMVTAEGDKDYMPPDPDVYSDEMVRELYDGKESSNSSDSRFYVSYEATVSDSSNEITSLDFNSGITEKVLIIPIAFLDEDFDDAHDQHHFMDLGEQLKRYYEINSGYVEDLSGMSLEYHVVEPVYSDFDMSQYGEDDPGTGEIDGANGSISRLTIEAMDKLVERGIDLSAFDGDDDYIIDHLIIVHAGIGQEQSTDTDLIWSHQFSVDQSISFGDYHIDTYIMVPENGELGVLAHEFAHDLGLPDLYDTNGWEDGYSYGIGRWGLMGSGGWNHLPNEPSGSMPSNLSAWSRAYLGWAVMDEITSDSLQHSLTNNEGISSVAMVIPEGSSENSEYYLIEYRNKTGYDAGLPGEGALIWHIDQERIDATMEFNGINDDDSRLGVELEQADGGWHIWRLLNYGDATDPFAGSSFNHQFQYAPYKLNLSNINHQLTYVDIMNIMTSDDICQFDIFVQRNETLGAPVPLAPANGSLITDTPVFTWEPVPHAELYYMELSTDPAFSSLEDTYSIIIQPSSNNMIFDGSNFHYVPGNHMELLDNTEYFWRLSGRNSFANDFAFSEVNSFTKSGEVIEPVEVSFSLSGDNANRLVGARPGMMYVIGDIAGEKQQIREDDMMLTSAEVELFKSVRYLYVFLEPHEAITDENTIELQLVDRDDMEDMMFFETLVWSEVSHEVRGLDDRFEYFHDSILEWEIYPESGLSHIDEGIVSVRYRAHDNEVEGLPYNIDLVDRWHFGNRFAWSNQLKDLTWTNEHSLYVLMEDNNLHLLDTVSNLWTDVEHDMELEDIIYIDGRLIGHIRSEEPDALFDILVEVDLESQNNNPEVVAEVGLSSGIIGGHADKVYMQSFTDRTIHEYELTDGKSSLVIFDEELLENEYVVYLDGEMMLTSIGRVFNYDAHTNHCTMMLDLSVNCIDARYDAVKEVFSVLDEYDSMKRYNLEGTMFADYQLPGSSKAIELTDSGFYYVFKESITTRVGFIEWSMAPDVNLSFDGEMKNVLIGSSSKMEISYGVDGFVRIPYKDYVINPANVSPENDIRIRFRDDVNALNTDILTIDVLAGLSLPELIIDDEENVLIGLDSSMEYSINGFDWITAAGEEPVFEGGFEVLVRMKAVGLRLHGEPQSFIFTENPPDNGGGSTGGSGGTGGGTPTVPVIPPVIEIPEEEVPEELEVIVDESIALGFDMSVAEQYLNVELYDQFSISLETAVPLTSERALKRQYLRLISASAYDFEIMGWIGLAKTEILNLRKPTTISIGIDLSSYSQQEIDRISVYRLENGDWHYIGGRYDPDEKSMDVIVGQTGTFAVLMGYQSFKDIEQHWAKHYIEVMAAKQITNGKGDNLFDPDSNITRAEYVALIVRSLGLKSDRLTEKVYEDVHDGSWYFNVINIAHEHGVISSGMSFSPDVDIVREDMMMIIVDALKMDKEIDGLSKSEVDDILNVFTDAVEITGANREAVALAVKYGIITGRRQDYLAIRDTASRAETMVVVVRLLEMIE